MSEFQVQPQSANGVSLTRDESKACYALIRHNVRTYESGGVVEVISGKQNAEMLMRQFEQGQASTERHAGWRYFLEVTNIKAGTDPAEATATRQSALESRESKEMLEHPLNPFIPSRHT